MENTIFKKYQVSSYEVDPNRSARLTTLANYFQEIAYIHAGRLEVGYTDLANNNAAWILSRMRIRIKKYPVWDDELVVETWPHGIEKIFALRDFRMRDKQEDVIAEGSTCWLMVDTKSHRPLRISEDFIHVETRTDSVFDTMPGKIDLPGDMHPVYSRQVRYSDLDVVGHVNNVKFIEWATDALDETLQLSGGILDFTINYIAEARPGNEAVIFVSEPLDGKYFLQGKSSDGKTEYFRAVASVQEDRS